MEQTESTLHCPRLVVFFSRIFDTRTRLPLRNANLVFSAFVNSNRVFSPERHRKVNKHPCKHARAHTVASTAEARKQASYEHPGAHERPIFVQRKTGRQNHLFGTKKAVPAFSIICEANHCSGKEYHLDGVTHDFDSCVRATDTHRCTYNIEDHQIKFKKCVPTDDKEL